MKAEKNKEQLIMPMHKVGIKILSDLQMLNIFPNYKNLLDRIENHREQIRGMKGERLRHYQYNMMYDNVFSIFGKRGTGKTSVAFTLQKLIEENEFHPYDMVLPIIIPEAIPADCSALGWILAIIGEQVAWLEKETGKFFDHSLNPSDYDFWKKCKYQGVDEKQSSLRSRFEVLEELYFSVKYNPSSESSYSLAVGNSARQAQNYYQFAKKITEFWDSLVEEIKTLYGYRNQMAREDIVPLIYFIFDDVDLDPEKVSELMSIIIKYLSHPNIIVITTADEEMVLEVIENNLDKNIGRIPKEWRAYLNVNSRRQESYWFLNEVDKEKKDLISETARLYLGKVMPTSTRYYLKLFENSEEKQWFRISNEKQLSTEMVEMVDRMIRNTGSKGSNFLKEEGIELDFYLNFFGNTSRQIGNAFLGVQEFLSEMTEIASRKEIDEEGLESAFHICVHFLHVAINANHNLAKMMDNTEEFVHEVFWLERNGWKLYIDYAFLREFLQSLDKKETRGNVMRATLQLYSLLLFVENVILIMDKCTSRGITGRDEIHGISGMTGFICEKVFRGRQKFRMDLTSGQFFLHYKSMLNRVCYLAENIGQDEEFDRKYLYDFLDYPYKTVDVSEKALLQFFEKSREWLRETAGVLSMVYGNLYSIGKKEMETCLLYRKEGGLCKYQQETEGMLRTDIMESLKHFDLRSKAQEYLKNLNDEFEDEEKDGDSLEDYSWEINYRIKVKIQEDLWEKLGKENEEIDVDDEEFHKKYIQESGVPLSGIIREIDEDCKNVKFFTLLQRLPQSLNGQIRERLTETGDKDSIQLLLNMVQDFLIRWDYQLHNIQFENLTEFLKIAKEMGEYGGGFPEIKSVADRILSLFAVAGITEEDIRAEGNWSIFDTTFYTELKTILRSMYVSGSEEQDDNVDGMEAGMNLRLEKIEGSFDIAIDLENEKEFRSAVMIGIVIQVIKQLQRLYLYQSIVQKYELGYSSSSARLEKMTVRNPKKKTKKASDNNSYYYAMFLTMNELSENREERSDEEMLILGNFIHRASSEKRHQYLAKLMNEAKDESDTN